MDDLGNQHASGLSDTVCEFLELGNQTVLVQCGRVAKIRVFAVNGYGVDDHVSGAPLSTADKNICQLFRNGAIGRLVIHAHRSHCYTVLQRSLSQFKRAEEF